MKTKIFLIGLFVASFLQAFSVPPILINGPDPVTAGSTTGYYYNAISAYASPSWVITGGSVVSTSVDGGTQYSVTVHWGSAGTGTITFKNSTTTIATKNITINAAPATTFSGGGNYCVGQTANVSVFNSVSGSSYQLYLNGTAVQAAKTGTGSTLTWQVTAGGTYTNTATPGGAVSGSAVVVMDPGPTVYNVLSASYCGGTHTITLDDSEPAVSGVAYFLKKNGTNFGSSVSGNNHDLNWTNISDPGTYTVVAQGGDGCSSNMNYSVVINAIPSAPPPIPGNSRFGAGTVVLTGTAGANGNSLKWYTTSTGGTSLFTGLSYSPNVTASTVFYASTYYTTGGCESTTRTMTSATIAQLPVISSEYPYIALGEPTTLTTGTYSTYVWKDSNGTVKGTDPSLVVTQPGNYTVTVTASTVSGPGTSPPFYVGSELSGINMNYVVSNTVLSDNVTNSSTVGSLPVASVSQTVQYYDGLGRPLQTIATQSSPAKHDIVTPASYDGYGREKYKYLPFVAGNSGNYNSAFIAREKSNYATSTNPQYQFYQGTTGVPTDSVPYSNVIFEASPLNRPLASYSPGQNWAKYDKKITYAYPVNIHGTGSSGSQEKIIIWKIDSATQLPVRNTALLGGYYPSGSLTIKSTTDEEGHEVREYTDKMGRVLVKKVQVDASATNFNASKKWSETDYIYNDFGLLAYVLQPELSDNLLLTSANPTSTQLTNYAFQYTYDKKNRMVMKRVPGADWVYMVYDKRDRVVLTQDGNQRPSKKWSFTKYDGLNRPVMTGIYTHGSIVDQQGMTSNITNTISEAVNTGLIHGYTTTFAFPTTNLDILSVVYYDNNTYIKTDWGTGFNYVDDNLSSGGYNQPDNESSRTVGFTVGSKVKVLDGGNTWLRTISYYDEKGRLVETIADNNFGGKNRTVTILDFTGRVLKSRRTHQKGAVTKIIDETFEYDHAGRVETVYHSLDGATPVLMVKNEYNELGQLIDKKLHSTNSGANFAQSVDYRYNIRGWLTSINNSDLTTSTDASTDGGDLFGFELGYERSIGTGNSSLYNGNISAVKWSNNLSVDEDHAEVAYNYTYDQLNRIQGAAYRANNLGTWSNASQAFNDDNYSYDLNGNIRTLTRRDRTGTVIDNLSYDYNISAPSNQLLKVSDSGDKVKGFIEPASTSGNDYVYDANGNMISDKNKDIVAIHYNHLNLPDSVKKGDGNYVKYIYDATGMKLSQTVYDASKVLKKRSDYAGEYFYENDTLKFINTSDGRIVTTAAQPEYQYHLKDHLGNVRVTFTTKPETDTFTAGFETANAVSESNMFNPSYSNVTFANASIYNHTPSGSRSQRLMAASSTDIIGLAKGIKVMPGDTVKGEVWAKYFPATTVATNVGAQIFSAIASAFGVSTVSTGEGSLLYQTLDAMNTGNLLLTGGGDDQGEPKAFLNYIVFDDAFVPYDFGFKRVSTSASSAFEYLNLTAVPDKPGYVYFYYSNENDKKVEVYFDDFEVEHVKSPVIQSQDYYPFGLTFNSYQRENSLPNQIRFQGQEHQDELDLGWDSFKWRNHMPDIGRFFNVDPLAEKYVYNSSYAFAENKIITFRELEGLEGVHYMEKIDGKDTHIIEKNILVLLQEHKTANSGATKKETKKIDRQNRAIDARNAQKMVEVLTDANKFYNGADNKGSQTTAGQPAFFKFNLTGIETSDTNAGTNAMAAQYGLHTAEPNGSGDFKIAPAAIVTTKSSGGLNGSGIGNIINNVNAGAPGGTYSHEFGHSFGLPDSYGKSPSNPNGAGVMGSPPAQVTSSEVDEIIRQSYRGN